MRGVFRATDATGRTVECPRSSAALVRAFDFGDSMARSHSRQAVGVLVDAAWVVLSLSVAGRLRDAGLPDVTTASDDSELFDAACAFLDSWDVERDGSGSGGGPEDPTRGPARG